MPYVFAFCAATAASVLTDRLVHVCIDSSLSPFSQKKPLKNINGWHVAVGRLTCAPRNLLLSVNIEREYFAKCRVNFRVGGRWLS